MQERHALVDRGELVAAEAGRAGLDNVLNMQRAGRILTNELL